MNNEQKYNEQKKKKKEIDGIERWKAAPHLPREELQQQYNTTSPPRGSSEVGWRVLLRNLPHTAHLDQNPDNNGQTPALT